MIASKYNISLLNGYVKLNTLSKGGRYFYKIRKPYEIGMGVFAADLSFFTINGNLIYCTPVLQPASYMPPFDSFNNVIWLSDQCAFFIEYQRNNNYLCKLFLEYNMCFKKKYHGNKPIETVTKDLMESEQLQPDKITDLGFKKFEFGKEYLSKNYKNKIFKRWFPKG